MSSTGSAASIATAAPLPPLTSRARLSKLKRPVFGTSLVGVPGTLPLCIFKLRLLQVVLPKLLAELQTLLLLLHTLLLALPTLAELAVLPKVALEVMSELLVPFFTLLNEDLMLVIIDPEDTPRNLSRNLWDLRGELLS